MGIARQLCVYALTHIETNRMYVGKTDDPLRRLRQHVSIAGRAVSNPSKQLVHRAIAKHGTKSFTFRVLEWFDDEDECLLAETRWIRALNSVFPAGFNLSEGGHGGVSPTQEVRDKISKANRGKPKHTAASREAIRQGHLGVKASPETREKMRARMTGTKLSEETRAKMRATWKRRRANGPSEKELAAREAFRRVNVGRVIDEATRAKMSASRKGQKRSPETCEKLRQLRLKDSPETKARRTEAIRAAYAAKAERSAKKEIE